MKTLLMLVIFLGAFLVFQGVSDKRVERARSEKRVEYRYIPHSALDEQYFGTPASDRFQAMFAEASPPGLLARTDEEAGKKPPPGDLLDASPWDAKPEEETGNETSVIPNSR